MTIKKTKLMLQFENETGKHSIWKEKITTNFKKWEIKRGKKSTPVLRASTSKSSLVSDDISQIRKLLTKFQDFEMRLSKLENVVFQSKSKVRVQEISKKQFNRTLKNAYNGLEKRFGDFVSISAITNKIQDFIPWSKKKIHDELYKLFMEYKVDMQPGKRVDGEPLVKDGQTFVWFKIK